MESSLAFEHGLEIILLMILDFQRGDLLTSRLIEPHEFHESVSEPLNPEIEERIIQAFGHSRFEFEATLHRKLELLTNGFVLSRTELRHHLENMEIKGIVSSSQFLGMRCWTRRSS